MVVLVGSCLYQNGLRTMSARRRLFEHLQFGKGHSKRGYRVLLVYTVLSYREVVPLRQRESLAHKVSSCCRVVVSSEKLTSNLVRPAVYVIFIVIIVIIIIVAIIS